MTIRSASIEDIDNRLFMIFKEGFFYHYSNRMDIFTKQTDVELRNELVSKINSLDHHVLVLEENDCIKGMVIYQIREKHSRVLWVDELVIDLEERNKGYAKALMDQINEIAKRERCVRVEFCCWSFNENALEMYKHLGFKEQRKILEMNIDI